MMRKETEYILGEVEHLLSYGLDPVYIAQVLGRKRTAIAKLAQRYNKPEIAKPFNKQKEN